MEQLLKTTIVRFADATAKYGCEITLPQTLRDILQIKPGEDYLEWYLRDGEVIVRKKIAPKKGDE